MAKMTALGKFFQILTKTTSSWIDHANNCPGNAVIDPEENDRIWYNLIAGGDGEILESLCNPKSAEDFFLRLKAEPLLDHPRLFRVARKRLLAGEITSFLDDPHRFDFEDYLDGIDETSKIISDWIPFGYVLNNQPEAVCMQTEGGSVVIVSEILRNALFFMNLGFPEFFDFDDVPGDVQSSAIAIAGRTMMLDEALDFELDPRGEVPSGILSRTWAIVGWQMQFVIGHEFAHHRLGHLHEGKTTYRAMTSPAEESYRRDWIAVRRSWQQEYEADIEAINAIIDPDKKLLIAQGAALFFLYLGFFEEIFEHFNPSLRDLDTHPPTISRLKRLISEFGKDIGADLNWADSAMAHTKTAAKHLVELNVEIDEEKKSFFGWYGSVYLGQWKGPDLIDRVDY